MTASLLEAPCARSGQRCRITAACKRRDPLCIAAPCQAKPGDGGSSAGSDSCAQASVRRQTGQRKFQALRVIRIEQQRVFVKQAEI